MRQHLEPDLFEPALGAEGLSIVRWHPAWTLTVTITAGALLTLGASGCSPGSGAESATVTSPAESVPFGYSFEKTKPGATYLFGGLELCTDAVAPATVTKIEVQNATGGLTISDFATRLRHAGPDWVAVGNADGPLDEFTWADPDSPAVTGTCTEGREPVGPTELMIELSKTDTGSAVGGPLTLTYESGGRNAQITLQMTVALCSSTGPAVDACRDL